MATSPRFAIVQTGGKQFRVSEGQTFRVEKLNAEAGKEIVLSPVLLVVEGDRVEVGQPHLKTSVRAKVVRHGLGEKVLVQKFKPKVRYRRLRGHRQQFTELTVTKIGT